MYTVAAKSGAFIPVKAAQRARWRVTLKLKEQRKDVSVFLVPQCDLCLRLKDYSAKLFLHNAADEIRAEH